MTHFSLEPAIVSKHVCYIFFHIEYCISMICKGRCFLSFIVRVECRLLLPQPLITFVAPGIAEFVSYLPLFFSQHHPLLFSFSYSIYLTCSFFVCFLLIFIHMDIHWLKYTPQGARSLFLICPFYFPIIILFFFIFNLFEKSFLFLLSLSVFPSSFFHLEIY